jgi:arsenate reductase
MHRVLFFCNRNSARSIMAESLLHEWGKGKFRAFSAGLDPKGSVHPLALATLERHQLPTEGLRSKRWCEVAPCVGPSLDFVVTVCACAGRLQSPPWPGEPLKAHWLVDDPGSDADAQIERSDAFDKVFHELEKRIKLFTQLPICKVDRDTLQRDLDSIGLP